MSTKFKLDMFNTICNIKQNSNLENTMKQLIHNIAWYIILQLSKLLNENDHVVSYKTQGLMNNSVNNVSLDVMKLLKMKQKQQTLSVISKQQADTFSIKIQ